MVDIKYYYCKKREQPAVALFKTLKPVMLYLTKLDTCILNLLYFSDNKLHNSHPTNKKLSKLTG